LIHRSTTNKLLTAVNVIAFIRNILSVNGRLFSKGITLKGLIAVLILLPTLSIAGTFEYGWMPVVGAYKSSLDKGTEIITVANALSGLVIINSGRNSRVWVQGQYHSLDFNGSDTNIGQSVTGYEVATIYQTEFRLSRHFKPWLGIGASFSALDYKDRYLTDSQGFLAQVFNDTSKSGLAIDFNISTNTDWFDQYDSGFAIRLSVPVNDVPEKLEAGFYIMF
jgi:hypothetical protein